MKARRPVTPEEAKLRMASLCARSEQCSYDVERKLRQLGLPGSDIARIMEELCAGRFVDDARFARSFARDKVRFAGWGPLKIKAALAAKRITGQLAAAGLDGVDTADVEAALKRAASAKARGLDMACADDRRKLLRYLLSRGFAMADCMRALRYVEGGS